MLSDLETGGVLYINTRAAEFFGIDAASAVGENAREYWVDASSRDRFTESLRKTGRVSGMESMLKSKDGPRWVMLSSNIIVFSGEEAAFTIFSDITERKNAEDALRESERQLKTLLDSLDVGVIIVDAGTHEIVSANRGALELFGAAEDAVIGKI